MLRSVPMSKVLLLGPRAGLEAVADLLHRLHRAHVVRNKKPLEGFGPGRPLAAGTAASEQLVQLRSLKSTLPTEPVYTGPILKTADVQALIAGTLKDAEQKLLRKMEDRDGIQRKAETVTETLNPLGTFQALQLNLDHFQPCRALHAFTGTIAKDPEAELTAAGIAFELFKGDARSPQAIALFVAQEQAGAAGDLIGKLGFREERLPTPTAGLTDYQIAPDGSYGGTVDSLVQQLGNKAAALNAELQSLDREIQKLRETWSQGCLPAEEHLQIQVEKSELPFDVLVTDHAYMVEFWLPDEEVSTVRAALEKGLGDQFHFEVVQRGVGDRGHGHDHAQAEPAADAHGEAAHGHDEAGHGHGGEAEAIPVKLNNPPYFNFFEMLTKMFSTPKYDEIDPTMFLSIFFPIYFGLMVGDVGYGILIALIGAIGFKAGKPGSDLRSIGVFLISGGLIATFLGYFVFGDLFGIAFNGSHGQKGWIEYLGMAPDAHFPGVEAKSRIHKLDAVGVNNFLVLSLVFGMVHMGLGFLLGFLNDIKHSVKHGIAKLSWFFVLMSLGLVVLNLEMCRVTGVGQFFWTVAGFMEDASAQLSMTKWLIVFGVGLVGLLATEPAGLVELLGPLSNTISYTRLAGIGVAKAALAVAMNQMILPLWDAGIAGKIGCIVLLIVAHAMVLGLGILSGAVQAMRLNFFEFFSKFMAGGGTDYAPFGRVRQYTATE